MYQIGLRIITATDRHRMKQCYTVLILIDTGRRITLYLFTINRSPWGAVSPGGDANRLEKFMLFFGIVLFLLQLGVSGSILRVINSYDNQ